MHFLSRTENYEIWPKSMNTHREVDQVLCNLIEKYDLLGRFSWTQVNGRINEIKDGVRFIKQLIC